MKYFPNFFFLSLVLFSCMDKKPTYTSYDAYPAPVANNFWLDYQPEATIFTIWSPTAEKVKINLYEEGIGGKVVATHDLEAQPDGVWQKKLQGDFNGTYYTYQVKINGSWLDETPGIYAKAVGANGHRAMVLDMKSTNPEGWDKDRGPILNYPNEAIIYELHIRDLTIHPQSGSGKPGTYSGLTERGTTGPGGVATGIDHIKELGISHVHLLPSFDFYSVDETKLDSAQFNWGYDPQNYNVPEGSFSTNPYEAATRIKEFKAMVKAFHEEGIGVILDVVYNHTWGGASETSNFNLEVPGYYYRHWEDGKPSDASACGNETASDREMMRKFILESVLYWAEEYHLDGFRFDLMGIHDIPTMNLIASKLKEINPHIFVYGEGWTAGDSPLPFEKRAVKKNILEMPMVSAFSDDIRDGIKGSVFEDQSTGFVSGAENTEESIKFGLVGSIQHPQINYKQVNYSDTAWAIHPWQAISYVSCHDNHTLFDKLQVSRRDASLEEIIAMDKLANAIVLTSQGIAFLHAGEEMLRTKKEAHNSYNLPDSINHIDWNWKLSHGKVVDYYKNLIALRKAHPAFRMPTGDEVRANLTFEEGAHGVVSYQIANHANGDSWKNILVVYNATTKTLPYNLSGTWLEAVKGDNFDLQGGKPVKGKVQIPPVSMYIAFQN